MMLSPIFKHAIESFEHGLEHYLDGTERSRKFALLHIDQAVELLAKEKIVRLGKSIYKTDGTTLSFHEAFRSLKDLRIPERPRLEELHDLRNVVQHKGLTPDAESTDFYVRFAYGFIKRFLSEGLATPIDQVINRQYRALVEGRSMPEMAEAFSILRNARTAASPSHKIVAGYTALSQVVDCLADPDSGKIRFRTTLREAAERRNVDYGDLKPSLDHVLSLRNQVLHSDYKPSEDEAEAYLDAAEKVLTLLELKAAPPQITKS